MIRGNAPGTARLTVKSNGQEIIPPLDLTVKEAFASVDLTKTSIELSEKEPFDLSLLNAKSTGKSQGDVTTQFPITFRSTDPALASIAGTILTANRAPRGNEE